MIERKAYVLRQTGTQNYLCYGGAVIGWHTTTAPEMAEFFSDLRTAEHTQQQHSRLRIDWDIVPVTLILPGR